MFKVSLGNFYFLNFIIFGILIGFLTFFVPFFILNNWKLLFVFSGGIIFGVLFALWQLNPEIAAIINNMDLSYYQYKNNSQNNMNIREFIRFQIDNTNNDVHNVVVNIVLEYLNNLSYNVVGIDFYDLFGINSFIPQMNIVAPINNNHDHDHVE